MGSLYIFTIAHHSLPGVVIKTDGAPNYHSDDLWHVWGECSTMNFYTDKIFIDDFPYVQFNENRFKIAELWLVCDRSCSQCDGDFILIRYESYEYPNGAITEYWYKGKQIPEVQAINGYVKKKKTDRLNK